MMMVVSSIVGIVTTAVAFFSSYLLAGSFFDKKKASGIDYFHLGFLFFIFHVIVVVGVSGIILRNLDFGVLGVVSLIVSGVVILWKGRNEVSMLHEFRTSLAQFGRLIHKNTALKVGIAFFVVLQVIIVSRITLAPPNVFDAQVYHLPISAQWFQNNSIDLFEDVPVGRFNYATKASKLLNFWMLAFTRGNIELIELTQYFGFALLMLSVYGIMRSLKVPAFWGMMCAMLVAFIPIMIIETHTLQDHMLLIAFHFSVVKLLYDLFEGKFTSKGLGIVSVSVAIGLLLAGKFSAPAHVGSLAVIFILMFFKEMWGLIGRKTVVYIALGMVIVGLVGGLWYAVNFANYGGIFGPKHPQASKENILLTNIWEVPGKLFEFGHRYTPDLIHISGYGSFVATVGVLLALMALVKFRKNRKVLALTGSTIILHGFYFSVYLTPYNYRLLSFTAATIIILATLYVSGDGVSRLLKRVFLLCGLISMVFSLVTTIDTDYFSKPVLAWRNYLRSYPEDRTIVRFDHTSDKYRRDNSFLFIDQFIPANEPILYITQHVEGYDDVVVAGYYDNNLRRRVIWGGSLEAELLPNGEGEGVGDAETIQEVQSHSEFFNANGSAAEKLVPFMKANGISYLHSNSVFYYDNPVDLRPGSEFIEVTKNLWYLTTSD